MLRLRRSDIINLKPALASAARKYEKVSGGFIMTNRERENLTLSFGKPQDRGSVEETFYPWTLTVKRFEQEGLWAGLFDGPKDTAKDLAPEEALLEKYLSVKWSEGVYGYEKHLGFDPVRRVGFTLPFRRLEHQAVKDMDDWKRLKEQGENELQKYFTNANIQKAYSPLKEGHDKGDYSVRMNIEGFFWTARELMGIEAHMFAFYDMPELIHDINEYIVSVYLDKLIQVLEVLPADVVYIMEDLSGKNGPMLSPAQFDEFVGSYYKRLIPLLKQKGVRHVFVDTDGDFQKLIPNFISAGVEGFLPMDVNAGMDIVKVRREFPKLKFIGAYNKLCIADGKEAIDAEFDRVLPVVRQGGYIPGCDHQVAPSTSLENYRYYISRLKQVMKQAGADL